MAAPPQVEKNATVMPSVAEILTGRYFLIQLQQLVNLSRSVFGDTERTEPTAVSRLDIYGPLS